MYVYTCAITVVSTRMLSLWIGKFHRISRCDSESLKSSQSNACLRTRFKFDKCNTWLRWNKASFLKPCNREEDEGEEMCRKLRQKCVASSASYHMMIRLLLSQQEAEEFRKIWFIAHFWIHQPNIPGNCLNNTTSISVVVASGKFSMNKMLFSSPMSVWASVPEPRAVGGFVSISFLLLGAGRPWTS